MRNSIKPLIKLLIFINEMLVLTSKLLRSN